MSAHQLARKISARLGPSGLRLEGNPRTAVSKAAVAMHLMGQTDSNVITRAIIDVGHFNLEEPSMEACATWLPEAMGNHDVPVSFVPTGDPFSYIL